MPTLMPNTTGDPLCKIGVVGWGEESPVRLLTGQSFFARDAVLGLRWFSVVGIVVGVVVVALLRLHLSPMVRLSLLSVVYKKGQCGCQADDDQTLDDVVVDFVVVIVVSTRHAFGEGFVIVVVCAMVVGMGLFEEVGDPFAERPFFLGFFIVSAL